MIGVNNLDGLIDLVEMNIRTSCFLKLKFTMKFLLSNLV